MWAIDRLSPDRLAHRFSLFHSVAGTPVPPYASGVILVRSAFLVVGALLFVGGTPTRASDESEQGAPHVWTREDLERLYGPASPPTERAPAVDDEAEQQRIESFLARQYARLDAERELELRRRQLYGESEDVDRWRNPSGYLALAPWAPWTGGRWYPQRIVDRPLPALPPRPGWISKPGHATPTKKPGHQPRLFMKHRGTGN